MRLHLSLTLPIAVALAVPIGFACGGDDGGPGTTAEPDAAAEATADVVNVGPAPACIKSPAAAPFPTTPCTAPRPAQADSFDEALGTIGLDRCTLALDPSQVSLSGMNPRDPRALKDFSALHIYPL